jgi:acyl-CoA thioester hydrolase
MADLRLTMTEPLFQLRQRVIYGDTDAGGIVYYANYLRFMEAGRNKLMRSLALPYSEIEQQGLIIPVTECYIRCKAPARYDDLITIAVSLAELTRWSCRFHYRLSCQREEQEQLLVKGFTKHACIDRQGKLMPFPEKILLLLQKYGIKQS